jgi:hypothetical protein
MNIEKYVGLDVHQATISVASSPLVALLVFDAMA